MCIFLEEVRRRETNFASFLSSLLLLDVFDAGIDLLLGQPVDHVVVFVGQRVLPEPLVHVLLELVGCGLVEGLARAPEDVLVVDAVLAAVGAVELGVG